MSRFTQQHNQLLRHRIRAPNVIPRREDRRLWTFPTVTGATWSIQRVRKRTNIAVDTTITTTWIPLIAWKHRGGDKIGPHARERIRKHDVYPSAPFEKSLDMGIPVRILQRYHRRRVFLSPDDLKMRSRTVTWTGGDFQWTDSHIRWTVMTSPRGEE